MTTRMSMLGTGFVAGWIALLAAGMSSPAAAAQEKLVFGAKSESELRLTLFPRTSPEVVKEIEAAFNARYGLTIRLNADLTGRYSTKAAQGVIEHRSGARPSYDVMILPEAAFEALDTAGALEAIEDWEAMLPEGADQSVSPGPIAGRGFKSFDLFWGYSYNPEKIERSQLPRNLADLGDPRFAGKIAISSFATNWQYALMHYSPEEFLQIASGWARNEVKMLHPTQMAQHVSLGEYQIGLFQTTEQVLSARQQGGSLEVAMWNDIVPHGVLLHAVRKGARAPNAAKLFTLWSTGREAVELFGSATDLGSALYPGNEAIDLALKLARETGVRPTSFFDNDENYAKLKWLSTREGEEFSRRLTNAIRGQ